MSPMFKKGEGTIVKNKQDCSHRGRSFACGFFMVMLCAGTGFAQDATQKAWDILRHGASDSDLQNARKRFRASGLIKKSPQAEAMAVNALTTDAKPEVRAAGAEALGDMLATAAIPQLDKALKDADVSVVVAAAHALYLLKQPGAYEVYYAILSGEQKSGQGLLADQKKMLSDPEEDGAVRIRGGDRVHPLRGGRSGCGEGTDQGRCVAGARGGREDPCERSGSTQRSGTGKSRLGQELDCARGCAGCDRAARRPGAGCADRGPTG